MWSLPSVVRKRGSSACLHCGYSNGNRAFTCKACKTPLSIKHPKRLRSADVSDLCKASPETPAGTKIFSTRVRRDGPDYRTLVVCTEGKWKCFYKECTTAQDARERSASFCNDYCEHIATVKEELPWHKVDQLELNVDVLSKLPIPPSIRLELEQMKEQTPALIQRVSSNSFVIRMQSRTSSRTSTR